MSVDPLIQLAEQPIGTYLILMHSTYIKVSDHMWCLGEDVTHETSLAELLAKTRYPWALS